MIDFGAANQRPGQLESVEMVQLSDEGQGDPCALFHFLVWGVGGVVLCCCGYTGNLLSVIALQKDVRTPATTLLQTLAVSDLVLLTVVCVTEFVPRICDYGHVCDNVWVVWPPVRYLWLLVPMAHMCSIWIAVLIAANRYWAVCRPHDTATVWTNRRTWIYVACVAFGIVVFNVPRIFEYRIVYRYHNGTKMADNATADHVTLSPDANSTVYSSMDDDDTGTWRYEETTTEFGKKYAYTHIYKVGLVNSLLILLPLGFLLVSSIWVIRSLHLGSSSTSLIKKKASRKAGSTAAATAAAGSGGDEYRKSSSPSREVTFVLVTVVLVAVACQTPLAVFHFVRYLYRYRCGHVVFYLENISKFLVNLNACVNFVIYCILGPRFRRLLVLAVTCSAKETGPGGRGGGGGGTTRTRSSVEMSRNSVRT